MYKKIKNILAVIGGIVVTFVFTMAVLLGLLIYSTEFRINTIDINNAPNGEYRLMLQQVGEPFLFGAAQGRFVLKQDSKTIKKYYFSVANDGGNIYSEQWEVAWYDDRAEVSMDGGEAEPMLYIINFDGTVTEHEIEQEEKPVD